MRIEQISKSSLTKASNKDLAQLRFAFIKLWDKHFKENDDEVVGCFNRNTFLANYRLLLKEAATRSLEHSTCDIDRQAFKRAMEVTREGLDVAQLESLTEQSAFICVEEGFAKTEVLQLIVRGEVLPELIEQIAEQVHMQTNKECTAVCKEDFTGKCIGVFDRVLQPVKKLAGIEVKATEAISKVEHAMSFLPIAKSEERIVYGIVYEPDETDSQDEFAKAEEIRKAAHQFMEQIQLFKVNHKGKRIKAKVLESYLAPMDFVMEGQKVKKGTWVLATRILDDEVWKDIKKGNLTGYSMAGYARRV